MKTSIAAIVLLALLNGSALASPIQKRDAHPVRTWVFESPGSTESASKFDAEERAFLKKSEAPPQHYAPRIASNVAKRGKKGGGKDGGLTELGEIYVGNGRAQRSCAPIGYVGQFPNSRGGGGNEKRDKEPEKDGKSDDLGKFYLDNDGHHRKGGGKEKRNKKNKGALTNLGRFYLPSGPGKRNAQNSGTEKRDKKNKGALTDLGRFYLPGGPGKRDAQTSGTEKRDKKKKGGLTDLGSFYIPGGPGKRDAQTSGTFDYKFGHNKDDKKKKDGPN